MIARDVHRIVNSVESLRSQPIYRGARFSEAGDNYPMQEMRHLIETIASEEADRSKISTIDVLGASKDLIHSAARKRAWVRLVLGFGFSIQGVAKTWGCDRKCIQRALHEERMREQA